ncbi:MAG: DUF3822 family protein [Cytophagales bacterium]|nr:MAG: DUF3822 family protein [Cytophagales bacterium]
MIQIKDETFSVDEIYKYTLCFKISKQEIEIGVFDAVQGKYLVYESYAVGSDIDEIGLLEQIYKEHFFIAAGYWKKIVLVSTLAKFSYVPEEFFSPQNAIDLLRMNVEIDADKLDICYSTHAKQGITCIFAVEKYLLRWVKSKYPYQEISYLHENSCILEGLLTFDKSLESRDLNLFVQSDTLTLVAFKHGHLQYLNTFSHHNSQDFIYYVLLAIEKMGCQRQEANIVMYGNISDNSSYVKELRKYINSVKTGSRPQGITFGYKFDELQPHSAFDMFSVPIAIK